MTAPQEAWSRTTLHVIGSSPAFMNSSNGLCELSISRESILNGFAYPPNQSLDLWVDGIMIHELAHCLDVRRDYAGQGGAWTGVRSIAPADRRGIDDGPGHYTVATKRETTQLWREALADMMAVGYWRLNTTPAEFKEMTVTLRGSVKRPGNWTQSTQPCAGSISQPTLQVQLPITSCSHGPMPYGRPPVVALPSVETKAARSLVTFSRQAGQMDECRPDIGLLRNRREGSTMKEITINLNDDGWEMLINGVPSPRFDRYMRNLRWIRAWATTLADVFVLGPGRSLAFGVAPFRYLIVAARSRSVRQRARHRSRRTAHSLSSSHASRALGELWARLPSSACEGRLCRDAAGAAGTRNVQYR